MGTREAGELNAEARSNREGATCSVQASIQRSKNFGQSEVLIDLFEGPTGAMAIGRHATGVQGRDLVLFRSTTLPIVPAELRAAQRLAYPQCLELLSVAELEEGTLLASHFVPAVALQEILQASVLRERPLPTAVVCQIAAEALRICTEARATMNRQLVNNTAVDLHVDTVWISGNGQVNLSELGLACLRVQASDPSKVPNHNVSATAALIRKMLDGAPTYDAELDEFLKRCSPEHSKPFSTPQDMLTALSHMPCANQEEIANTVQGLCGAALIERQAFLLADELSGGHHDREEDTAYFHYCNEVTPVHVQGGSSAPPQPVDSSRITPVVEAVDVSLPDLELPETDLSESTHCFLARDLSEPAPAIASTSSLPSPNRWLHRAVAMGAAVGAIAIVEWWL